MTFRKRQILFIASLLLYIILQFFSHDTLYSWRGELAVIPVISSALLFGLKPNLIIMPLLLFPFNILLCFLLQIDIRSTVLTSTGIGSNFAIMLFGLVTVYILDINIKRKEELTRLKQAEEKLKDYRDQLESMVDEKTAELSEKISQLKTKEQELIRLSKAIEQASEQIIIMDSDGTVQYVNPAICNILGYNSNEIIGTNIFNTAKKLRPDLYNTVLTTINKGGQWTEILTHKKKDGGTCLNETTISPIFDSSGTLTNLLSIARDVTNEAGMEKRLRQAQKMESIGTLAGGIAHDFNNILAGIIGYTELSKDNIPKNSPVTDYLNNTLKLTSRAEDLVSQILTFSRKSVDKEKPIDIVPVLNEALKLLCSTLPRTIEIEKNIDDSSAVVLGDPSSIHQIVMNLMTNAAQSIKGDTGIIKISLTSERLDEKDLAGNMNADPGMFVKLTVQDNGSGIDPLNINHIFDPFFTTKEVGKGTGMGLSVVHGIITAHGGLINVNSVPNEGTTFNVFIPKTEMKATETVAFTTQAIPGTANILFVDDEELLRDIAQLALSSLGYNVTVSSSALESIKVIKEDSEQFDLVITDLSMPKMSGVDLSKKLLELRPEIPVILCSGNKGDLSDQSIKDAGIRATIMKPITKAALSRVIFDVLNEKEN